MILLERFICRHFKTDIWLKFWLKKWLGFNIFPNNVSFILINPNYKFGADSVQIRQYFGQLLRASAENCTF